MRAERSDEEDVRPERSTSLTAEECRDWYRGPAEIATFLAEVGVSTTRTTLAAPWREVRTPADIVEHEVAP